MVAAVGRGAPLRHPLVVTLILALVIQVASATWWITPYTMPNAALVIAYNVERVGHLEGGSWMRLKGAVLPADPPLQAYHLPGEPLYLAAGLALHRPALFRYWHVPVAALLVVATAASALALFGPEAALAAGAVAALDPVTAAHGPVYDDTFLGAACLWVIAALCLARWSAAQREATRQAGTGWAEGAVLLVAAGWAAITRSELQLALVVTAIACLALPALRPLRRSGLAIGLGVLLAVGAWGTRNMIVQHHVMLGSSHDGLTLWESTEPQAGKALTLGQVDALSSDSGLMTPLWRATRAQDEAGADAVFQRAAIVEIMAQPVRVARLAAHKIAMSLAGLRPGLPASAPRNLVAIVVTSLLWLGAGAGMYWRRIHRPHPAPGAPLTPPTSRVPAWGAALLGLETVLVLSLGPVGFRYWMLWRPVAWVLAGCGIAGMYSGWRAEGAPSRNASLST